MIRRFFKWLRSRRELAAINATLLAENEQISRERDGYRRVLLEIGRKIDVAVIRGWERLVP